MAHPWELTLDQFLARLRGEYGIDMRRVSSYVEGPRGRVRYHFLVSEGGVRVVVPKVGSDDVLPVDLMASILRQLGLPTEDFHLDPD